MQKFPAAAREAPFAMAVCEPFDWNSLLAFLGARAIPGLEEAGGGVYRRRHAGGGVTVRYSPGTLLVEIDNIGQAQHADILMRVRRLFDVSADVEAIRRRLSTDPLLEPMLAQRPGLRVPGAWDPFEIGIRAVLGQQVSVAGARTLAGRLVGLFGMVPAPQQLAEADLTGVGLTGARQETLRALARAALDGNETLHDVRGIGPWTREYYAMRALGDPDAFPAGDLVLRKAANLSGKELSARAESWRPWRAYAAMHLWRSRK